MGQIEVPTDEGTLVFATQECDGCVFVHLENPNSYRKILLPSWIDKANRNNGLVKLRHNVKKMGARCPARHFAIILRALNRRAIKERPQKKRRQPKRGISVKKQKCRKEMV